jgi:putative flippase GtrA
MLYEGIMTTAASNNLLKIVFYEKTNNTYIQLFRYLFVGGAAFVLDMGVLLGLTEIFDIHYLVSAAVAFMFGLTANFIMSTYWIFQTSTVSSRSLEFAIFGAVGIVGLGLNELSMWIFTDLLLFYYALSKVFSTVFVFLWNFIIRKLLLYRQPPGVDNVA